MAQFETFGKVNIEVIFNGTFTVENTNTGEYRTFKITKRPNSKFKNAQVVSLLTGSDNENDYTAFAFINRYGVHIWKRLQATNPRLWRAYGDLLFSLLTKGTESFYYKEKGYIIRESTKCMVCGRTLTTPESIDAGIGPDCAAKGGMF